MINYQFNTLCSFSRQLELYNSCAINSRFENSDFQPKMFSDLIIPFCSTESNEKLLSLYREDTQ